MLKKLSPDAAEETEFRTETDDYAKKIRHEEEKG